MDNLHYYELSRSVPENAQKPIKAGRLKGMTDINPMWRIKKLTEMFGVCGIGWKTEIVRTWLDEGANGEIVANVEILLFIRDEGEWSEGIPGIGGSKLVAKEREGMYTDDECYKKAHTDAISVACKALGIGADIYWNEGTKYSGSQKEDPPKQNKLTYEDALELSLSEGVHAGKTLKEVWKTAPQYINTLMNDPGTPESIKNAVLIIQEGIKKAKAQ